MEQERQNDRHSPRHPIATCRACCARGPPAAVRDWNCCAAGQAFPTPNAIVIPPEPHFWFSILEEIEPVAERQITCADIKRAVASHFKVSVHDIISARRTANVILPRHLGMYLAREMTPLSLPQIGRQFNREHCAVLYAFNKIAALLSDPEVAEALKQIRDALRAS